MSSSTEGHASNRRRALDMRLVGLAGLALLFASFFALSKVYASLTVAFVLAYLLEPVVEKLEKKGVARGFAVPMTLVVLFALLTLAGIAIVPRMVAQFRELILRLPAVYHGVAERLSPFSEQYLGYNVFNDTDKLMASFGGDASTLVQPIGGIVGGVFAHTVKIVTTVLGLLIIPLLSFYLLRDFPRLYGKFMFLVPPRHHRIVNEVRDRLDMVFGGFIRGQLVVSTILAAYYATAFAVMGLELALVLGLMAGFFNVVPYLGIVSVLVLTLLIAFIHNAGVGTFVGIGCVFAVGMAAEGSFLTPRIVGRKVGLSPLTLILALLVGGQLLGLVGMLIAVPIAAIAKVFFDVAVERYRSSEAFQRQ